MKNKRTVIRPLSDMAFDLLRVLITKAGRGSTFKGIFTLLIEAEEYPVLILGNAHGVPNEDGHAIAVLNPDIDLKDELHAGCSYSGMLLKEIVAGRCNAMVEVWLDAYIANKEGETVINDYVSRSFNKPKFEVS